MELFFFWSGLVLWLAGWVGVVLAVGGYVRSRTARWWIAVLFLMSMILSGVLVVGFPSSRT